jgi:Escherichia/Staphylococcus phage prohead protease
MITMERRTIDAELRAAADEPKISGYSIRFDSWSDDLGGFRERIAADADIQYSDVVAKFNHDSNFVIGRLSSGTLKLTRDEKGVLMEAMPPSTTWANDLLVSMRRGDIKHQSFEFRIADRKSGQIWEEREGVLYRTLTKIIISDVSVVTNPAYQSTNAQVRSMSDILADRDAIDDVLSAAPVFDEARLNVLRRRLDLSARL